MDADGGVFNQIPNNNNHVSNGLLSTLVIFAIFAILDALSL